MPNCGNTRTVDGVTAVQHRSRVGIRTTPPQATQYTLLHLFFVPTQLLGDESSDDNLKCPGSRNKTVSGAVRVSLVSVAHNGPGHSQHQSQYYLPHRPQSQVTSNGEYNGPAHHSGTYGDIVYTTWPHVFISMTGARTFTWCVTLPTQLSRPAITSIFKHFIFGILNIHNLLF